MYDFQYTKVQSIDDAVHHMQQDEEAVLLAGGMTLLPALKQRLAQPTQLLDLSGIENFSSISVDGDAIRIAALTTHAGVAGSPLVQVHIPALAALANSIGDPQVRNRGTLGGSIANADPAADYPAALVALDATVITTKQTIAAEDFFVDLFETVLESDEIITAVSFPKPRRAAYAKFANPASRYAVVGVFVAESDAGCRVAVTGAQGSVFRWQEAEAALSSEFDAKSIESLTLPTDDMNEDLHATADYRAHLVVVMACQAVREITG